MNLLKHLQTALGRMPTISVPVITALRATDLKSAAAHLVAVHAADELVHDGQGLGLGLAVLLAQRVVQVVGVDHAHDVPELVGPPPPMVVPVQVLRLLQHRHVRLQTRPLLSAARIRHSQAGPDWKGSMVVKALQCFRVLNGCTYCRWGVNASYRGLGRHS